MESKTRRCRNCGQQCGTGPEAAHPEYECDYDDAIENGNPATWPPALAAGTGMPPIVDEVTNEIHAWSKAWSRASAASFHAFEARLPHNPPTTGGTTEP